MEWNIYSLAGLWNRILIAQNVRSTVTCTECGKPRCVYSKLKLTPRDVRALKHTIEKYDYTCGAILAPEGINICYSCSLIRQQNNFENLDTWTKIIWSVLKHHQHGPKQQTIHRSAQDERAISATFK